MMSQRSISLSRRSPAKVMPSASMAPPSRMASITYALGSRDSTWCGPVKSSCVFFFKQETAYEIGLGIPAEPLFRSGAEFTENIINGVERPVKAAELFAFILRVRARNTDVLTDAEENVRQKLRAEGVM